LELIAGTGSRLTPTALPARAQLRQAPVIEFVKIPPGDFVMGCSNGDAFCEADEKPAHRVYITRGFELGKFELTQKQWETVMGFNPSRVHAADKPVDNVSWNDAQEFISVLTSLNDGYRYRLPTEAEWEYAARAGVSSAYTGWLDTVGWHQSNASEVQPIGTKTPNAFGLYDMEGNVYEWVQDWYSRAYYRVSPANDPPGPSQGQALPSGEFNFSQRVARSGSIGVGPRLLRVSNRATSEPDTRSANYGFRVAREALR
jgi:formylglycine-generating enzyme required for sulfatase activity